MFKDVSMVCSAQECPLSSMKNHNVGTATISRVRSLEEDPSGFEFHKARSSALLSGFSKPAPSKWDDAQKWIASPGSNRGGRGRKSGRQGGSKVVVEVEEDLESRRVDVSEILKREIGGEEEAEKEGNWVVDPCGKEATIIVESSIAESAASKEEFWNDFDCIQFFVFVVNMWMKKQ